MSCLDDRSFDLRRLTEFQKMIDGHKWTLVYSDTLGEKGVLVRYSCTKCGKEWTTMLLSPEDVRNR